MNHDNYPEDCTCKIPGMTTSRNGYVDPKFYILPEELYFGSRPLKDILREMVEEILKEKGLI